MYKSKLLPARGQGREVAGCTNNLVDEDRMACFHGLAYDLKPEPWGNLAQPWPMTKVAASHRGSITMTHKHWLLIQTLQTLTFQLWTQMQLARAMLAIIFHTLLVMPVFFKLKRLKLWTLKPKSFSWVLSLARPHALNATYINPRLWHTEDPQSWHFLIHSTTLLATI